MAANAPFPLHHENVLGMIRAAEASGFTDAQIGRLIDVCGFGDVLIPDWQRGALMQPQSDGFRIHALPCGSLAGPDHGGLTAGEMPLPHEIDESNAREAEGRRAPTPWPLGHMEGSGL
jgi:hypothetical protein